MDKKTQCIPSWHKSSKIQMPWWNRGGDRSKKILLTLKCTQLMHDLFIPHKQMKHISNSKTNVSNYKIEIIVNTTNSQYNNVNQYVPFKEIQQTLYNSKWKWECSEITRCALILQVHLKHGHIHCNMMNNDMNKTNLYSINSIMTIYNLQNM